MENEIVHSTGIHRIVHSDLIFSSSLWLYWRQRLLHVHISVAQCIVLIAFVLRSCLWNAQISESEIKYYLSMGCSH